MFQFVVQLKSHTRYNTSEYSFELTMLWLGLR